MRYQDLKFPGNWYAGNHLRQEAARAISQAQIGPTKDGLLKAFFADAATKVPGDVVPPEPGDGWNFVGLPTIEAGDAVGVGTLAEFGLRNYVSPMIADRMLVYRIVSQGGQNQATIGVAGLVQATEANSVSAFEELMTGFCGAYPTINGVPLKTTGFGAAAVNPEDSETTYHVVEFKGFVPFTAQEVIANPSGFVVEWVPTAPDVEHVSLQGVEPYEVDYTRRWDRCAKLPGQGIPITVGTVDYHLLASLELDNDSGNIRIATSQAGTLDDTTDWGRIVGHIAMGKAQGIRPPYAAGTSYDLGILRSMDEGELPNLAPVFPDDVSVKIFLVKE